MGKREAHLSQIINWLFSGARVHNEDDGVWEHCEFLWIDGSLFYRAFNWAKTGTTWRDYANAVCTALREVFRRCPRLRVVVYSIDKYGYPTRSALPKEPTQAHRYEGCQPVPAASRVFHLDESCVGISSTDTFGDMRARMAFNAMISVALMDTLRTLVYDAENTVELAILDGAVSVVNVPRMEDTDYEAHESDPPRGKPMNPDSCVFRVYRPGVAVFGTSSLAPTPEQRWCCHSEGDIALAYWLPQFAHLNSVVHSCDVDLQQVSLQVVRRLADAGLRPDQLPRMHLFKKVGSLQHTFDLKRYFQLVCSIVQPLLAPDDPSHPMDVWAALTAVSGNDFCAPWLCSEKCRLGEKDNDGIRLEAVWTAFVTQAHRLGPFFLPATKADIHSPYTDHMTAFAAAWMERIGENGADICASITPLLANSAWSSFRLPAYAYPMEMNVAAWRSLMEEALALQQQRTDLRVSGNVGLIMHKPYVMAQLRRMSWALSYYANSALLGDQMPRGTECDAKGRSLHGWSSDPRGNTIMSSRVAFDVDTVCGVSARSAPTAPPSPTAEQQAARDDPVGHFERLCAAMDE